MNRPATAARWEQSFPAWYHRRIARLILEPIRMRRHAGLSLDLDALVDEVASVLQEEIDAARRGGDSDGARVLAQVLERIDTDEPAFRRYLLYRAGTDLRGTAATAATRRATKGAPDTRPPAERPPSERQVRFLRTLGYTGPAPKTVAEAGKLIGELKPR